MSIQHSEKKLISARSDIANMLDRMKDSDKGQTFCPFVVYTEKCRLLYSGSGGRLNDAAFTYKTRKEGRQVEPVEKAALYIQDNKATELNLRKVGNASAKDDLVEVLLNYFIKENFNNIEIRRSCSTAEKLRMVSYNPMSQEFSENLEGGILSGV